MKERVGFVLVIIALIFTADFVLAGPINDSLHLNIQTTNSTGVATGTFKFEFNISTSSDCAEVVYHNFTTLTTDSRGIISYYLENTNLNYSDQYWLCYYRDGVLINNSKIARTPYAFRSLNLTLSGVEIDANLEMGNKNITTTGTGFFTYIGSLVSRITSLFVQNIDFTGNINGSGNITTTGMVGIGTETPSQSLDVRGRGNFSGTVYINNGTDISTFANSGSGSSSFFVNYTFTTTTGNITNGTLKGYPAANNICIVEVEAGSHMCSMDEILNTISNNRNNQNFTATFRASEGAPGYLASANDCEGWTSPSSSALGSIWVGSKTHLNTYGAGGLVGCNAERAIACCK